MRRILKLAAALALPLLLGAAGGGGCATTGDGQVTLEGETLRRSFLTSEVGCAAAGIGLAGVATMSHEPDRVERVVGLWTPTVLDLCASLSAGASARESVCAAIQRAMDGAAAITDDRDRAARLTLLWEPLTALGCSALEKKPS